MSLFYAEATPMLKTLSNATTKFVSEVSPRRKSLGNFAGFQQINLAAAEENAPSQEALMLETLQSAGLDSDVCHITIANAIGFQKTHDRGGRTSTT